MGGGRDEFYSDPDNLAEGFLQCHFVWEEPTIEQRHLADWTLRWWRGGFYRYEAGRYISVSDDEIRLLVKRHIHELNCPFAFDTRAGEQYVRISRSLLDNVLVCVAGTEGVHLAAEREPSSWSGPAERMGAMPFWRFANRAGATGRGHL